ncbi:hypothetical protein ABQX22_19730 [Xanthomonas sp. WHRI 1810A]|uniref:hypothetical protein n=1 Tax=Xanthomonas sp. WHRI 1810A TaxID=3161565 RepID=UPI0032E8E7B0
MILIPMSSPLIKLLSLIVIRDPLASMPVPSPWEPRDPMTSVRANDNVLSPTCTPNPTPEIKLLIMVAFDPRAVPPPPIPNTRKAIPLALMMRALLAVNLLPFRRRAAEPTGTGIKPSSTTPPLMLTVAKVASMALTEAALTFSTELGCSTYLSHVDVSTFVGTPGSTMTGSGVPDFDFSSATACSTEVILHSMPSAVSVLMLFSVYCLLTFDSPFTLIQ